MDKPGFLEGIYGMLFNPGGDVDGLRRAATACRTLSAGLHDRVGAIDPVASGLVNFWQGKEADGFQGSWQKFKPDLAEYATQLADDAAVSLDKVADFLHQAQRRALDAQIMIVATIAAGVAATFFTFGLSDAAAAGAVDAEVTALGLFMARMGALLACEAEAISALMSALMTTIGRFLVGFLASEASSMLVKGLVLHEDVLDPENWTAQDLSKALLDASLVMGMGAMFSTPKLTAAMDAHPVLGFVAAGAGASAAFSAVSQFWFDHASITDADSWFNMGESALVGGASGLAMVGLFQGLPTVIRSLRAPAVGAAESTAGEQLVLLGPDGKLIIEPLTGPGGRPLFPEEQFPRTRLGLSIDGADLARAGTGLGSDMINYIINYPELPEAIAAPAVVDPGPVVPDFPVLPPPPPPPPKPLPPPLLGGGTYTVHRGDSLWTIASRVYGDGTLWTKIAAANPQIANPDLIYSGQVLTLPKLPAPHAPAAG